MRERLTGFSSEGLAFDIRDDGPLDGPVVVALHGFPQTSACWSGVTTWLVEAGYRVLAPDQRGYSPGARPQDVRGYAMSSLCADVLALADTADVERFHLLGHDWGAVQLWEPVTTEATDRRLTGRLASFTSISGPNLDHVAHFFRSAGSARRLAAAAQQALRASYVGMFCLPVLPELALRPFVGRNGTNGVNLYRANLLARLRAPRAGTTDVPVQLIQLTRDPFIIPALDDGIERWVRRLERVRLDAGHWAPRSDPDRLATLVAGFVDRVESGQS